MYVVQQHVSTDPSLTGSVGISVGWRTPGVSGRSAPVPLFRKNPVIGLWLLKLSVPIQSLSDRACMIPVPCWE